MMMRPADGRFTLLGDEPNLSKNDPLGFDSLAEQLADLILRSRASTPLALGVRGAWGSGKSSVMRRVDAALRARDPGVKTVWFSAWTAERGNTLEALIKSVLEEIDPNVLRRALRNQNLITGIRAAILLVAGWFQVGNLVNSLWKRLEVDPRARNQVQALLEKTMKEWLARTPPAGSSGHLIVVFIDDLDRCSPTSVFKIFEAVKLYLNAPGFVFVLGYDETAISEAVLAEKQYSRSTTSKQYLEKIIQIAFRLPRPDDSQIATLMEAYLDASGTTTLLGDADRRLIVEQNGRNPRRIKRFINNFVIDYRLDDDSAEFAPEVLIKALILQDQDFDPFTRLFSDTARKDLITEFVEYERLRTAIRRGEPLPEAVIAPVFEFYGITPPPLVNGRFERPEEAVRLLEARAPKDFAPFLDRTEFVELLRGLTEPDRQRVVERVLRTQRRMAAERDAQRAAQKGAPAPEGGDQPPLPLTGLRVLWIDGHPRNNAREVEEIKRRGGMVEQVLDAATARQYLAPTEGESSVVPAEPKYHVLVSSIQRPDTPEGGIEEAARYRKDGLHTGPIIFYTQRITQRRQQLAAEIEAQLTNDLDELLRLLHEAASLRARPRAVA